MLTVSLGDTKKVQSKGEQRSLRPKICEHMTSPRRRHACFQYRYLHPIRNTSLKQGLAAETWGSESQHFRRTGCISRIRTSGFPGDQVGRFFHKNMWYSYSSSAPQSEHIERVVTHQNISRRRVKIQPRDHPAYSWGTTQLFSCFQGSHYTISDIEL